MACDGSQKLNSFGIKFLDGTKFHFSYGYHSNTMLVISIICTNYNHHHLLHEKSCFLILFHIATPLHHLYKL